MRYSGYIGFDESYEKDDGIWDTDHIIEMPYYGDVVRNIKRFSENEKINDDLNISNQFSIVANQYAFDGIGRMRYITFMNQKWKITSIEVQYPRLIISVGGLYNE